MARSQGQGVSGWRCACRSRIHRGCTDRRDELRRTGRRRHLPGADRHAAPGQRAGPPTAERRGAESRPEQGWRPGRTHREAPECLAVLYARGGLPAPRHRGGVRGSGAGTGLRHHRCRIADADRHHPATSTGTCGSGRGDQAAHLFHRRPRHRCPPGHLRGERAERHDRGGAVRPCCGDRSRDRERHEDAYRGDRPEGSRAGLPVLDQGLCRKRGWHGRARRRRRSHPQRRRQQRLYGSAPAERPRGPGGRCEEGGCPAHHRDHPRRDDVEQLGQLGSELAGERAHPGLPAADRAAHGGRRPGECGCPDQPAQHGPGHCRGKGFRDGTGSAGCEDLAGFGDHQQSAARRSQVPAAQDAHRPDASELRQHPGRDDREGDLEGGRA